MEYPKRLLVATSLSLATAGAMSPQAEAIRNSSVEENAGTLTRRSIALNARTGEASCTVSKQDANTVFGGLSIIMRIESKYDGEWSANQAFPDADGVESPDTDPNLVSAVATRTYSVAKLGRAARFAPTRVVCYGGGGRSSVKQTLPQQLFNRTD